jgi:hypothetical protein
MQEFDPLHKELFETAGTLLDAVLPKPSRKDRATLHSLNSAAWTTGRILYEGIGSLTDEALPYSQFVAFALEKGVEDFHESYARLLPLVGLDGRIGVSPQVK